MLGARFVYVSKHVSGAGKVSAPCIVIITVFLAFILIPVHQLEQVSAISLAISS